MKRPYLEIRIRVRRHENLTDWEVRAFGSSGINGLRSSGQNMPPSIESPVLPRTPTEAILSDVRQVLKQELCHVK